MKGTDLLQGLWEVMEYAPALAHRLFLWQQPTQRDGLYRVQTKAGMHMGLQVLVGVEKTEALGRAKKGLEVPQALVGMEMTRALGPGRGKTTECLKIARTPGL